MTGRKSDVKPSFTNPFHAANEKAGSHCIICEAICRRHPVRLWASLNNSHVLVWLLSMQGLKAILSALTSICNAWLVIIGVNTNP